MDNRRQIHELRKKKNITQETRASEMGITVGAVSKWETGCSMPDIVMLCNLADFFQVTTDELLGRHNRETFLICDDAPIIRNTLCRLLREKRFPCGAVENGQQLYKKMREEPPYGLFLDIHLGDGEDGLEILQKVKKEYPYVKVVIITGDHSEDLKQRAMEAGADGFINKPFHEGFFYEALEALLDTKPYTVEQKFGYGFA